MSYNSEGVITGPGDVVRAAIYTGDEPFVFEPAEHVEVAFLKPAAFRAEAHYFRYFSFFIPFEDDPPSSG